MAHQKIKKLTPEDRIKQLLHFLEEDPHDAFSRYALGLEYRKTEPQKAEELFNELITDNPDYLPAYYMAAVLKSELGKTEAAMDLLKQGIALATRLGDTSTLRELNEALQQLES
ncbi:MAG: tetratricopeptide repeat protein [Cyclobacteriaceae bacterium]|nr:tetratricopeptide repeat protein [Cyclobacteriaceae bacterium]